MSRRPDFPRENPDELIVESEQLTAAAVPDELRLATVLAAGHSTPETALVAIASIRRAHPGDFDEMLPCMWFLSNHFQVVDWAQVLLEEAVEALYAIAKYASFAVTARLSQMPFIYTKPN